MKNTLLGTLQWPDANDIMCQNFRKSSQGIASSCEKRGTWSDPVTCNTFEAKQNGWHFADDIFKWTSVFWFKFHWNLSWRLQVIISSHNFACYLAPYQVIILLNDAQYILGLPYQPQCLIIHDVICILFFFTTQESDFTQLWPVPLTIFIQIWNVTEISNCFSINFKEIITTKFCTCHDSTAVMACAKFCNDYMLINNIQAIFCFE